MLSFIKKLFAKEEKLTELSKAEVIEAGACPNCWGIQEYEGKVRKLEEDLTKSNLIKSKGGRKSFVSQFVETNITGIRLKKDGENLACPKCKAKFQRK